MPRGAGWARSRFCVGLLGRARPNLVAVSALVAPSRRWRHEADALSRLLAVDSLASQEHVGNELVDGFRMLFRESLERRKKDLGIHRPKKIGENGVQAALDNDLEALLEAHFGLEHCVHYRPERLETRSELIG